MKSLYGTKKFYSEIKELDNHTLRKFRIAIYL